MPEKRLLVIAQKASSCLTYRRKHSKSKGAIKDCELISERQGVIKKKNRKIEVISYVLQAVIPE